MRLTPLSAALMVPASQFRAGDIPPICAMTGLPAETSRRFTFSSLRWWPLALLPLAGIVGHVALGFIERRVTGKLPLTRASASVMRRTGWQGLVAMVIAAIFFTSVFVIGGLVGPHPFNGMESIAAGILVLVGLLLLVGGTMFLLIASRLTGPRGTVSFAATGNDERTITIWNVHPAFAAAVQLQRPDTSTARQTP